MRLFDLVAHSTTPMLVSVDTPLPETFEVTAPCDYARLVAECPLRYVIGDDLTRACAELAFADGARLAGCLDLVRVPASRLWVEWNDEIHHRVIHEVGATARFDAGSQGRRVGALLESVPDGRRAVARTFWGHSGATDDSEVFLSPVETHIHLAGADAPADGTDRFLSGGFVSVTDTADDSVATLLGHLRFRLDERWGRLYRRAPASAAEKRRVLETTLSAVSWDAPFLLAFFLLLAAKDATQSVSVSRAAINRKRCAKGHRPLLDHVEVRASLEALSLPDPAGNGASARQSPRLHHVRGHLVRRASRVFWRIPHLRGSGARGCVRSRTVCLSMARQR
jgi:hypothetical protein